MLTDAELQAIEQRAQKATPGPWKNDVNIWRASVNDGSVRGWSPPRDLLHGHCPFCGNPKGTLVASSGDEGGSYHLHSFPADNWRDIVSGIGVQITGNYDYEEGGVCSTKEDSDFIAHARSDVPALLRDLKEAREALQKYGLCHKDSCNCYYMDGRSGQKLARKCSCGADDTTRRVLGLEP